MNLIKLVCICRQGLEELIYTIAKDLKYDVPIVACAVDMNHRLIAIAVNSSLLNIDPTAHAEMLLIRSMAKIFNIYRLTRL